VISWMLQNKDWLFGGLLVSAPVAFVGWIITVRVGKRRDSPLSQQQTSGANSTNLQSGRDTMHHSNDSVVLGGLGVAAKLAGGGGGGVIGSRGQGGPGGSVEQILLDGQPGRFPGSGGGGGGALADDAVDPEVQPGSEGKGGVYGMDGQPGRLSSFGNIVVAPAGAAGRAGGIRLRSAAVKVSSLLVGEHFHVRDGLAFTVAGGLSWVSALNLPQPQSLPVLIVIEAGGAPPGDYTIRLEVRGPDDQLGGEVAFPLTVDEQGEVLRVPFPVSIPVEWTCYGTWMIVAASDSGVLSRYDVIVKRVAS